MTNSFNTLRDRLNPIREHIPITGYKQPNKSVLPSLNSIGDDGVKHLNIWEHGATEVGVALSHMADLPFTHETYGKFRSVEGFWHYIRSVTRDDRTRMMSGYKAKKYGDTLLCQRVDDFKAIIMDANWQKIKQYKALLEELKTNTLPFDSYYLYNNDVRVRPASAIWIIQGFNEISLAIKENREPNFDFLRDRQKRNVPLNKDAKVEIKQPYKPATLTTRFKNTSKSATAEKVKTLLAVAEPVLKEEATPNQVVGEDNIVIDTKVIKDFNFKPSEKKVAEFDINKLPVNVFPTEESNSAE